MASFNKVPAKNKKGYRWECIKDGPPDPVTGKRNQIKRRGETKEEAEKRVDDDLRRLTEHGIDVKVANKITFAQVAEEWLEAYSRSGVKKSTIRLRKNSIKILNRYFAAGIIDKITHKAHQKVLNDMDDQDFSKSHIEGVHVTANLIYKHAMKEKYRIDNPAAGAKIPTRVKTVEEIENSSIEAGYLERHELAEFLAVVEKYGLTDDKEMFFLMAFTGMRSGEMLSLKETDFFFDDGKVRITKTLYNPDNNLKKYELTPPKTPGSIRTIDLDPTILQMIKDHVKNQRKLRMNVKNFNPDYHDAKFIFCNEEGYPYIQKTVIRRMDRLLRKTTIRKEATPHIFRHTHISMLAEAEVDLPTIMQRVGHDDPKTTLKIYTHVTEKMKKGAVGKVQTAFADLLKPTSLQGM